MSIHTQKHPTSGKATYSFNGDDDTGIDSSAANQVEIMCGGTTVQTLTATTTGITGPTTTITATTALKAVVGGKPEDHVARNVDAVTMVTRTGSAACGSGTGVNAATGVVIVTDAEVGSGRQFHCTGLWLRATGSADTAVSLDLTDTNGTPVKFTTIAVAGLTNGTLVNALETHAGTTFGAGLAAGGTVAKGVRLIKNGDGSGSDIGTSTAFAYTLTGFIK